MIHVLGKRERKKRSKRVLDGDRAATAKGIPQCKPRQLKTHFLKKEAADRLGISDINDPPAYKKTARSVRSGGGRRVLIPRAALEEFLEGK